MTTTSPGLDSAPGHLVWPKADDRPRGRGLAAWRPSTILFLVWLCLVAALGYQLRARWDMPRGEALREEWRLGNNLPHLPASERAARRRGQPQPLFLSPLF